MDYGEVLDTGASELYDEALSRFFSPSGDSDLLVSRGRFRPPGNHHLAVFDYFAERYDAEELHVVVPESSERTWNNPITSDEVVRLFREIDDERNAGYDLVPHEHASGPEGFRDSEVTQLFEEEPVVFTRDPEHVYLAAAGKLLYKRPSIAAANQAFDGEVPRDGGFSIDYEPRSDETPFKRFEGEVMPSSSSIRRMIGEREDYSGFVPGPVQSFVEDTPEVVEAIEDGDEDESGKWLELLNG